MKSLRQFFIDLYNSQDVFPVLAPTDPPSTVGGFGSDLVMFASVPKGASPSSGGSTSDPQQIMRILSALPADHDLYITPLGYKTEFRVTNPQTVLAAMVAEYGPVQQ